MKFLKKLKKTYKYYKSLDKKERERKEKEQVNPKLTADAFAFLTCPRPVLESEKQMKNN